MKTQFMKTAQLLLLLVVYSLIDSACSRETGGAWKNGKTYRYELNGRQLTGLHQLSHQYTGILLRGKVDITKKADNIVNLHINKVEYAEINQNLTAGWETEISDNHLNYQSVKLSDEPVDVYYKQGAVSNIIVSENLNEWQVNLVKAIVSLIQVDLKGVNAVQSKTNQIPTARETSGYFKTMEDTVSGECLTTYTVVPLPKYMIQSNPQWAPLMDFDGKGSNLIQVVKAKNYSNCENLPRYNHGFSNKNNFEPGSSRMGKLLARTTLSRVTITALSMDDYAIQSSITNDQFIISPHMHNNQRGISGTHMNLTLFAVHSASEGSLKSVSNPKKYNKLVYTYEPASSDMKTRNNRYIKNKNFNNDDNSSSSSSSSSNESRNNNQKNKAGKYAKNERYSSEETGRYKNSQNQHEHQHKNHESHNHMKNEMNNDNYDRNQNYNRNNDEWKSQGANNYDENSSRRSDNRRQRRSISSEKWDKVEQWNQPGQEDQRQGSWNQRGSNNLRSQENWNKNEKKMNRNNNYDENNSKFGMYQGGNKRMAYLKDNQENQSSDSSSSSSENQSRFGGSSSSSSESQSSSSFSSSEEDWQDQATIEMAPFIPLTSHFVGYEGNSIQASPEVNVRSIVQKLSMQIASDLHSSESLTEKHTMSKYSVLTRLVETMSAKQMQETVKQLYVDRKQVDMKNTENVKKLITWEAYKHAIASSGTGSALLTIKDMIENNLIHEQRAAQLVSRLPKVVKLPNKDYLETLFSMIKSPVVQKQNYLNATSVMAFGDLLRMTYVSKSTAHLRYALHTFGRLTPKNSPELYEKYLPYLEENMKNAIDAGDSHKAQTYIHALGSTGHPRILAAFEDYLEGRKPSTNFQRFLMVSSMYHLVDTYSHLGFSVLKKIYQNYAEDEEIRVAAVQLIMLGNPSAETLQMLATSSHYEPNPSVKSAINSGIRSAAINYKIDDQDEVSRNAQYAENLVNPKEYGPINSKTFYYTVAVDDVDAMFRQRLNYIRSRDHFVPQSAFYSWQPIKGGVYEDPTYFAAMTSSVNKLFEKLREKFVNKNKKYNEQENSKYPRSEQSSWNAEKIAKLLGMKINSEPNVETHLILNLLGGSQMFSYGNSSFENIPRYTKELYERFKSSPKVEFTSMYLQQDIQIGLPTSMGFPFMFSHTRPTIVHFGGEVYVQTEPEISNNNDDYINIPKQFNVTANVDATFATQTESKFGFIAPFNHKEYISGVDSNVEMNAAFKSQIGYDHESNEWEIRIKPKPNTGKQVVFEYRTQPYTSMYDLLDFKPALEQSGTELVHVAEPVQTSYKFGKRSTGLVFQYNAMTERIDDDAHFFDFKLADFNRLPSPFVNRGIHANRVTVVYDPSLSTVDAVKFTIAYKYKFIGSHSSSSESNPSAVSAASYKEALSPAATNDYRKRQQQFLNKVAEGILEADARVIDFEADFEKSGQTQHKYVVTSSFAKSDVSPLVNALFYYSLNPKHSSGSSEESYEICASAKSYIERVPQINLYDAIKKNSNGSLHFNSAFGQSCESGSKFDAQFVLAQSYGYQEDLERDDMVNLAYKHIEKGHALSFAAQNATKKANMFDYIKLHINYDRAAESVGTFKGDSSSNAAQESSLFTPISVWLNRFGVNYVFENRPSSQNFPRNKMQIETQFSNNYEYVNVTILHAAEETKFVRAYFENQNLRVQPYRFVNWLMNSVQFNSYVNLGLPTCSLSEKYIDTFDNATYPAGLGDDWHVVMLYTPKRISQSRWFANKDSELYYDNKHQNVVIIAKDSSNGKHVKVMLGDNVVELKPTSSQSGSASENRRSQAGADRSPSAHLTVNGNEAHFSADKSVAVFTPYGELVAKIYARPNGEVTVYSKKYGLHILYNGENVDIYAAPHYKNNIRGLCGTYDGNKNNDFTTPQNCILQDPLRFASTYALYDDDVASNAKQFQQEAHSADCYRQDIKYADVISDFEAGRVNQRNNKSKRNSQNKIPSRNLRGSGDDDEFVRNQNIIRERDDKICISLRAYPMCRFEKAYATVWVEEEAEFYCEDKSSSAIKLMKNLIDEGAHPNLSGKEASMTFTVRVPKNCMQSSHSHSRQH